ncbi:MAG: hypothetical protein U5N86_05055 [Planctomycetota bacterium]|nr:hypothetical protein [Planctomycetota bacterium]
MRFTLVFTVFLCLAFLAFSAEESVSEENKPSIWEDFVYTELYSVEEPGNEWNWTSVSDGVGLNLERDTVNIRHRNKEDEWEKSSFQHDVSGLEFLGFRDSTVYCYAPKMKDSGLRYAESIRVLGISLSGERVCDVEFSDFPSYEEGDGPYPNSSDIDKYHYHFDCQVVLSSNGRELLLLQEASFFDLQRGTFANWGVSIETYLNLPDLSCTSKSVRSQQLTGILPSNDTITPDCRVLFTRDNPFDIISRYHGIETIVRAASNIDDFEITNSENCHPIIKTAAADIILVYLPPTMLEDHENVVVIVPKGDFEKAKAISVPLYPAVVFSVGSYILHMAAADEEYPTLFSVHDSLGIEINFSTGTVKRYPLPYFRIWKKGHSQYVVKYRSDRYALYNNISEYDLRRPLMPSQATATESFQISLARPYVSWHEYVLHQ